MPSNGIISEEIVALKIAALEDVVELPNANSIVPVDEARLQSTINIPCDRTAVGEMACIRLVAVAYGK